MNSKTPIHPTTLWDPAMDRTLTPNQASAFVRAVLADVPRTPTPDDKIKRTTIDFGGVLVSVERGVDDGALLVSIDTTSSREPKDHLPCGEPRVCVYINDATVYDFAENKG